MTPSACFLPQASFGSVFFLGVGYGPFMAYGSRSVKKAQSCVIVWPCDPSRCFQIRAARVAREHHTRVGAECAKNAAVDFRMKTVSPTACNWCSNRNMLN